MIQKVDASGESKVKVKRKGISLSGGGVARSRSMIDLTSRQPFNKPNLKRIHA
jgi:hypothetical protein